MASPKKPAQKVDDKKAFENGLRHGVLIHRGFKLKIGGEIVRVYPGQVIVPSPGDLADPHAPGSFVSTIALRCRGLRDGRPRSGRGASVFKNKKSLQAAARKLQGRIAADQAAEAARRVETELSLMTSQGRHVRTEAALDRLLDRSLGTTVSDEIKSGLKAALTDELGIGPPPTPPVPENK